MLGPSLWVVAFLSFPFLAYFLCRRSMVFRFLGPVLLAYLAGILLGNLELILSSLGAPALGRYFEVFPKLSENVLGLAIFLSIPLLLFTTDFRAWLKHAGTAAKAFFIAAVSVVLVAGLVSLLFQDQPESWKIGGSLVGVYTGGNVNMGAIAISLDLNQATLATIIAADVLCSGLYILFFLTLAKPLFKRFLPPYNPGGASAAANTSDSRLGFTRNARLQRGAAALGIGILIAGISVGLATLTQYLLKAMLVEPGDAAMKKVISEIFLALVMVFITPLAIAATRIQRIRAIKEADHIGDYMVVVFAIAFGTLVDASQLTFESLRMIGFVGFTIGGALALHVLVSWLLRIDVDTTIIISAAAVLSPPLISPIADAIKNREAMVSGLTTGIVGYAVGTYLGLGLAYALRFLMGG
jgi:uncharacterized membrane protein